MTASSFGTKNEPKFADADAPDLAVNPTQAAAFAAKVGNRRVGTAAERIAATGKDLWEGLLWGDTTDGAEYRLVGVGWVRILQPVTPWVNLTLAAGWVNQAGYAPLRSRVNQLGNVEIQGQILPRVGYPSTEVFATLPSGARPAYRLEIPVVGNNAATRVMGGVLVDTNGNMNVTQTALGAFTFGSSQFSTL